jgi:hypothetical protein
VALNPNRSKLGKSYEHPQGSWVQEAQRGVLSSLGEDGFPDVQADWSIGFLCSFETIFNKYTAHSPLKKHGLP